MYIVRVPGRRDKSYAPETITPRQAVMNGSALIDFVSSTYNPKIPFGTNWRESLVNSSGALLFSIDNPSRCLICRLCDTTRLKDSYEAALALLDIDQGWLYGFDVPPGTNAHYGKYDGTQSGQEADRLVLAAYDVLHGAWERVLSRSPVTSRRVSLVSAFA